MMTVQDRKVVESFRKHFRPAINMNDKKYMQNIIVLDTETTTTECSQIESKIAFSYINMFIVDGRYYPVRTPDAFINIINILKELTYDKCRFKIFVHNLGYDYIFFKNLLQYESDDEISVFSRKSNDFCKIKVGNTLEFCDTLALKNCSLAVWGKDLGIKKRKGDLDYSLCRNYYTEIRPEERGYNYIDVKIMYAGIKQLLEQYTLMKCIPITSTGVVRVRLREYLQSIVLRKNENDSDFTAYHRLRGIYKNCRPDAELLLALKSAYCGGITHASLLFQGSTWNNVDSYDITSSYPFQLVSHKYPHQFKKMQLLNQEAMLALITNIDRAACLFKVTIKKFRPKRNQKPISILSKSNVISYINASKYDNNGKILFADEITLFMNNIDYYNIKRFYDWDEFIIDNNYFYAAIDREYRYIDEHFTSFILKAYNDKTKLKNVAGYETEYQMSKAVVNGLYGMCVQFPLNDTIEYDADDCEEPFKTFPVLKSLDQELRRMNRKELFDLMQNAAVMKELDEILEEKAKPQHKQILLYQHGVWCTSYARWQLCSMIEKLTENFIYCDTDSIKCIHSDEIKSFFEEENKKIVERLKLIAYKTNRKFEEFCPKDQKGKERIIGLWDYEGTAEYFKTLGAKRYMKYQNNELHCTVAGCNPERMSDFISASVRNLKVDSIDDIKDKREDKLTKKEIDAAFRMFAADLEVPAHLTGKLTHKTFLLPSIYSTSVTDYAGQTSAVQFGSFIILEPCTFKMKLFKDYLITLNEREHVYNSYIK